MTGLRFVDTTPYDADDRYREDTSVDDAYRVVVDHGTVTIHDHTESFADNPVATGDYGSLAEAVADELITLQPEGTDWLAWATHYLTDIAEGTS